MPEIYVLTNRFQAGQRPLTAVLQEAAEAGADAVILREKDLSPAELYNLARKIRIHLMGTKTKLIINTSIETAMACGADGVHLGAGSLPLEAARRLLPGKTVGVSVHSPEEALVAQSGGADYVLAGHVFPTGSKPGLPGRGLEFIKQVSSMVSLPVIAIGGINYKNAHRVIGAGAAGIAVMSSVMESENITHTLQELHRALSRNTV